MTDLRPKTGSGSSISVADCADLDAVRSKAGFFGRLGARAAVSYEARQELKKVETERVREQGSIALTALKAAGVQVRSALVAGETPKTGALLLALNERVNAVRVSLTNASQAAVATHLRNRTNNVVVSQELAREGTISQQEAAVMQNFANADAVADVDASRNAITESKQAIERLRSLVHEQLLKANVDRD
jgi:hypothetical protein